MSATRKGHLRTALICGGVVVFMTSAAFAAVPLYKAFCEATGFGGAIPRASKAPGRAIQRELVVNFDTNVHGVPWTFEAEQRRQTIKIGATSIAYFKVTNNSDKPVTARAAYNVDPELAGAHLRKLKCFCFDAQTLKAHETAEFPVVYFVEPAFATDPNTETYTDITLSYTFVPAEPDPVKPKAGAKPA